MLHVKSPVIKLNCISNDKQVLLRKRDFFSILNVAQKRPSLFSRGNIFLVFMNAKQEEKGLFSLFKR